MRIYTTLFSVGVAAIVFLLSACTDFPSTFVAPVFNTGLALPLADTSFTLDQLLQDSSFLKRDARNGNFAIVKDFALPTIKLGDSLAINSVSLNYATTINEQRDMIARYLKWNNIMLTVQKFDSTLPRSGTVEISPFEVDANIPFKPADEVDYVHFKSGTVFISAVNNLPIDVEIVNPKGYNQPGIVIATPGESNVFIPLSNEQRIIRRGSTIGRQDSPGGVLQFALDNRKLSAGTLIKLRVRSQGSGAGTVQYTEANTFLFTITLDNPQFRSARLALPQQHIDMNNEAPLPPDTRITEAEISAFAANLDVHNDFALGGNATLVMPQLINARTNQPYTYTFRIEKKQTQNIKLSNNGDVYRFTPDAFDQQQGGVITKLRMQFGVISDNSKAKEDFSESDVFSVSGIVSPIRFKSATGLNSSKKQVDFSSSVNLGTDDISNLNVQSFAFEKVLLDATIRNGSPLSGVFNGNVTLTDKKGTTLTTLHLDERTIGANSTTDISYELKDLELSAFPANAIINGTVRTLNGEQFTVSENSVIEGNARLSIPLAMRLTGGEYSTAGRLIFSDEIKQVQQNINTADVLIESRNRIPASVDVSIAFYDEAGTMTLLLPAGDSPQPLRINPAVNYEASKSFTRLSVSGKDVQKLLNSYRYTITARFATPAGIYSTFKSSDYLHLKVNIECKANTQ